MGDRQRLQIELSELRALHSRETAEVSRLRAETKSNCVALKASRDGTKGLQEQRDSAKREAVDLGVKAAQLRSQLEDSEDQQKDVREELTALVAARDCALEAKRQALLTVETTKVQAKHDEQQLKQAHLQVVYHLQDKCANWQTEAQTAQQELEKNKWEAARAATAAKKKQDEVQHQLQFSIGEVQDLLARNTQLEKASTELKAALWSATGDAKAQSAAPKSPEEVQELDEQLIGQARRLNRVYGEASTLVPAMSRVISDYGCH